METVELVTFADIDGTTRPFIPSAVLYPERGRDPVLYGFDALYRAPEGTQNLKTGFKLDIISPPSPPQMQREYTVVTDGKEIVKTPYEVLEDFLGHVIRHGLITLQEKGLGPRNIGLILGVPAIDDEAKRQDYRKKIRDATRRILGSLSEIGESAPEKDIVYYEPFAVYKYYLQSGAIPKEKTGRNILIIDWGGGTMNVCIIRTTKGGEVAGGGSKAVPRTVDGIRVGGRILDKILVDIMFKDESKDLREEIKCCHRDMLEIERKKIDVINKLLHKEEEHPQARLDVRSKRRYLTAEMIEEAFQQLWHESIQRKIEHIKDVGKTKAVDLVILAGGSSRIPFIRDALMDLLQIKQERIVLGHNFEQAVGCGLAYVALEKLKGDPGEEKLVSYIAENIYLLAADQKVLVFPKDTPLLEEEPNTGRYKRSFDCELKFGRKLSKLVATYTEEFPEDKMEYTLNPIMKRFDLGDAGDAIRVCIVTDEDGYTEVTYVKDGTPVGEHDFYIGVGKLGQWSVDVAVGIDIGTTNTAIGIYIEQS